MIAVIRIGFSVVIDGQLKCLDLEKRIDLPFQPSKEIGFKLFGLAGLYYPREISWHPHVPSRLNVSLGFNHSAKQRLLASIEKRARKDGWKIIKHF